MNPRPDLTHPLAAGRTAEIYAWAPGKILKLYFSEWGEADVRYEANLTRAAHATGYLAPAIFEQVEINHRHGIVMERLDGVSLLTALLRRPWQARRLAGQMARLHAQMHTYPAPGLPDQTERLEVKIRAVQGAPAEVQAAALAALHHLPRLDRLCHSDFHPDNILILPDDTHRVIDWVDAVSGHPLADVSRTLLLLNLGELPNKLVLRLLVGMLRKVFTRAYLDTYFEHSPFSRSELPAFHLPVAFARLSEGIEAERERLVGYVGGLRGKE